MITAQHTQRSTGQNAAASTVWNGATVLYGSGRAERNGTIVIVAIANDGGSQLGGTADLKQPPEK